MRKGWYAIPGVQNGDRTLAQQVTGLEHIVFAGKRVLELGCAEGLMSRWMIMAGAKDIYGIDIVADHIKEAWRQCAGLPCAFDVQNLDDLKRLEKPFDIVMALAVFHKLKRPDLAARHYARMCKMMVVRLPPSTAPVVIDARSNFAEFNIDDVLRTEGFERTRVTQGPLNEWTGTYLRS